MPKFMFVLRATARSDSTVKPSSALIEQMMQYYVSLQSAGLIVAAEGFLPSSVDSYRLTFPAAADAEIKETKGPFPTNEIFSGWWIVKTKDVNEALEWARKCPLGGRCVDPVAGESGLEIRRLASADDFGEEMTKEQREREIELRKKEAA